MEAELIGGYKIGTYCNFFGSYAKVYTLSDTTGNIFYVGCTTQRMEQRMRGHLSEAKNNSKSVNHRKRDIIRKLEYKVIVTIVDILWVTTDRKKGMLHQVRPIENEWIDKYRSLGYELCNGRVTVIKVDPKPEYIGKTYDLSSALK